ncbi:GNAT family N-acetyltransferase [Clostridium autoethanogenum]|uniref:GNAT family N-acetyltransferase n=1 Tax=Clostridium autoethanogenum DSM 10061 TaxID=1341692 RepID=A0ABN4BFQ0_9CLOT|nr:GNAT family N-acetyltransferase [Clostridium autoethanogenum]AGY74449.1 GNAT family N-acetyltransferase [Clostridium autoethanogenum DSM 10061]ALU34637.1 GCN5-related N-acetyltransferase [Clostridium autoethanogenum DSM 10061]OVY51357.1 ribosomal-protein-alanine N-acetyltransferase [Clostridium autoethanogenum]
MYKCVKLTNKNLKYFRELNNKRYLFNPVNEDFFKTYDRYNFAKQLILRRRVKLIKKDLHYIGYIWSDVSYNKMCTINAMNVLCNCIAPDNLPYKYLINTIKEPCTIKYICQNNNYNFNLLKSIGFKKGEGTLTLYKNLLENIPLIFDEKLQFKIFEKGKDEQKRCEIQNEIFKTDTRVPLTLEDIYFDEAQDYYFEKGAIFLKQNDEYIGYGQIVMENDIPVIVNFGILKEFRGKKYGKALLIYLLKIMYCSGFNRVIIKVKSSNYIALQLYTNMGFRIESERYNWTLDKKSFHK